MPQPISTDEALARMDELEHALKTARGMIAHRNRDDAAPHLRVCRNKFLKLCEDLLDDLRV